MQHSENVKGVEKNDVDIKYCKICKEITRRCSICGECLKCANGRCSCYTRRDSCEFYD